MRQASQGLLRQIDNLSSQAKNGLKAMPQPYGDWCPPPTTQGGGQGPKPSKPFTATTSPPEATA